MIKNIIFDFGDIFINLDKQILLRELKQVSSSGHLPFLTTLNEDFETGRIAEDEFLTGLRQVFPQRSTAELSTLWNGMLLDFPESRLDFLAGLAELGSHRLFLLSNTNESHIREVSRVMGEKRYQRFKACFEGFHLSHEMGMRKPQPAIFLHLIDTHGLRTEETLFVDDTLENIEAAQQLGIQTWHLQVGMEDITQLKSRLLSWNY